MMRDQVVMTPKVVQSVRKALFLVLAVVGAGLAVSGFRFWRTQATVADLTERAAQQEKTLTAMRLEVSGRKPSESKTEDQGARVLANLQSSIERFARSSRCTINEFQTTPERAPYLSAFTLETHRPDWEQVSVRLTLFGTLSSTLSTVESLRRTGIPIEPDSIEVARQSVSEDGVTSVALRLAFRVLVKAGAPS